MTYENASKRPWRIEHVTRQREAVIRAADNAIVAVLHADNAELIVAAVNQFNCAIASHGRKPKAQRIECPTDLQAARADPDTGAINANAGERHPCPTKHERFADRDLGPSITQRRIA